MQNVKEWMDRIVAVEKERRNLLGFNDAISICSGGKWITFFQGLEIVADELGLEIKEEFFASGNVFVYTIEYGGFTFAQPQKTKMCRFCKHNLNKEDLL